MIFRDRFDAGKKLAQKLLENQISNALVLALPRGGVPIGLEVAKALNAPLDVLVVRKLGSPFNPEFGIGAVAPENVIVLDQNSIDYLGISSEEIKKIILKEQQEMERRIKLYRGEQPVPEVKGKTVVLVDDGLATGVTARAAIKAILRHNPQKLIVAMPVCALDAVEGIKTLIRPQDEIICLSTPYDFAAVGSWYQNFEQLSDQEVIEMLEQARAALPYPSIST